MLVQRNDIQDFCIYLQNPSYSLAHSISNSLHLFRPPLSGDLLPRHPAVTNHTDDEGALTNSHEDVISAKRTLSPTKQFNTPPLSPSPRSSPASLPRSSTHSPTGSLPETVRQGKNVPGGSRRVLSSESLRKGDKMWGFRDRNFFKGDVWICYKMIQEGLQIIFIKKL